ncbi:hypothetical protein F53441_4299 [Fusarium austroafricanum]|uniref:Uncharacterized protein n=1 Tax=Fusarium austroafricanum TaxID=2364996 RepID=A0A8H4KNT9_9HYPO|nr:hypothetical protein F53441_4299 [Fusarium austroafricanum]
MNVLPVTQFWNSRLYNDIERALHNILTKKRNRHAPPHTFHIPRYYIVTRDQTVIPSLGYDMDFRICDREHVDGVDCSDRHCFAPNASAREYLWGFMIQRARDSETRHCPRALKPEVHNLMKKYNIPSRQVCSFTNIVYRLFYDLHSPEKWDPEVQGVLGWEHMSADACNSELMSEVHRVMWRRNMNQFSLGYVSS